MSGVPSLERLSEDAPVVRIVNQILRDAIKRGATEIHIVPSRVRLDVSYSLGGVLTSYMVPPKVMQQGIIARLKILSQLDLARKDVGQEGRFRQKVREGQEQDFHIVTEPTPFGEKVTLRLA
jgi:type IV pilus assembly protein PilB